MNFIDKHHRLIALGLVLAAIFGSGCVPMGAQGSYGPQASYGPPPAHPGRQQTPAAPAPAGGEGIQGLDNLEPASADEGSEFAQDGTPVVATAQAWVRAPLGATLCFAGTDPHISEGPKVVVHNKTARLWLTYTMSEEEVIVLVPKGRLWRRQDNGYGKTVLGPGKFCVLEAGPIRYPNFMAYGYFNIGSKLAPAFRAEYDAEMKEPETIAVNLNGEHAYFPLSTYRFKVVQ